MMSRRCDLESDSKNRGTRRQIRLPLWLYVPIKKAFRRCGFVPASDLHTAQKSISDQAARIARLRAGHVDFLAGKQEQINKLQRRIRQLEETDWRDPVPYRKALIKLVQRPDNCNAKVLYWTKEEAEEAARNSELNWGIQQGILNSYLCFKCPPRPVEGGRFYHNGKSYRRPSDE